MSLSKNVYQQVLPPFQELTLLENQSFNLDSLKNYSCDGSIRPIKALTKLGIFLELKQAKDAQVFVSYTKNYPTDAFKIQVSKTISIEASSEAGVFYAFLSLYKLSLMTESLPYAIIYSEASVQERGLHLDLGRKFFSKAMIFKFLETMAFAHLNTFQLHFSENKGFRIACETYPEIVSKDHLSKEEILEIIEYANALYIQVIPSLDSPGHLNHALKYFPQYQLPGSDGGSLDISNLEARQWIHNLYREYAELFKNSSYFNIGGDEFVDFDQFDDFKSLSTFAKDELKLSQGHAVDTYLDYLNELADLLEGKGFVVRAWNDGLYRKNEKAHIQLKNSIQICYWTSYHKNMAELKTFIDHNHPLINFHAENFYYVLHVDAGVKRIDPIHWFESWTPDIFSANQVMPRSQQTLGTCYSIWCDAPDLVNEERIYSDVLEPLWAFATKSWSSKCTMNHAQFKRVYAMHLQLKKRRLGVSY